VIGVRIMTANHFVSAIVCKSGPPERDSGRRRVAELRSKAEPDV
jgi:hypothetical protein